MADDINSEKYKQVRIQIDKWKQYRADLPFPDWSEQLRKDLYSYRNQIGVFPGTVGADDPEVDASVEHYFLTYSMVATRKFPVWEVELMCAIYNGGKALGITPRHNPKFPTSPPSEMQKHFQAKGISDGQTDLILSGSSSAWVPGLPPRYYY